MWLLLGLRGAWCLEGFDCWFDGREAGYLMMASWGLLERWRESTEHEEKEVVDIILNHFLRDVQSVIKGADCK